MEVLQGYKEKEAKEHLDMVKVLSKRLKEQMIQANSTQTFLELDAVLQQAVESDRSSFDYLSTFHSALGMALKYSKTYSELVNVDVKRTVLLKRTLNEMVDETNRTMQDLSDFSQKRSCPSHNTNNFVNVGDSSEESDSSDSFNVGADEASC